MFQISEVLKKVPFFRTLGRGGIDFIVERLKFKTFDADETICKIGDPGDKMYIIISGKVNVVVKTDESKEETIIATLGSGDYFGEMALLTGEPRSATVVTTEPAEMFILNKADFDLIVERYPSITLSMGKIMSQRLAETLKKAAKKSSGKVDASVKGSLAEKKLVDILKFCESNSLNGKLIVKKGSEAGVIYYTKGELQKVEFGNLSEDQALDTLLNWQEGEFEVVPEPLKFEEEPAKSEAQTEEPLQLLIINTSIVVQKMLQRTFENIGYSVYSVENKQKGLNLIRKLQPDVVVTDTKLPDGTAPDLVQEIREISSLPIVLLTDERDRDKYIQQLKGFESLAFTRSQEVGEIMHAVQQITGR
ncbi:MAG TPA: cyclic nucleotide-binding domain-containing protein [Caldithrix sp.]|nr:cyclic nucleotide-binding domain-containing protein [Caldithrix sp.]